MFCYSDSCSIRTLPPQSPSLSMSAVLPSLPNRVPNLMRVQKSQHQRKPKRRSGRRGLSLHHLRHLKRRQTQKAQIVVHLNPHLRLFLLKNLRKRGLRSRQSRKRQLMSRQPRRRLQIHRALLVCVSSVPKQSQKWLWSPAATNARVNHAPAVTLRNSPPALSVATPLFPLLKSTMFDPIIVIIATPVLPLPNWRSEPQRTFNVKIIFNYNSSKI
jgi:hypothetical protein